LLLSLISFRTEEEEEEEGEGLEVDPDEEGKVEENLELFSFSLL
jgi:hypothetical protein